MRRSQHLVQPAATETLSEASPNEPAGPSGQPLVTNESPNGHTPTSTTNNAAPSLSNEEAGTDSSPFSTVNEPEGSPNKEAPEGQCDLEDRGADKGENPFEASSVNALVARRESFRKNLPDNLLDDLLRGGAGFPNDVGPQPG